MYKWTYASGNDAGNYKFFVPGVVVPLITTVGVNGKITFVEKAGTGPPNSTGAFELDPSLAGGSDPVSTAWRTMRGLKTDVFCSAGLTLPDKAGRQITIGGWSGTSTVGLPFAYSQTYQACPVLFSIQQPTDIVNTTLFGLKDS